MNIEQYKEHLTTQKDNRLAQAALLLLEYGQTDGAHHKQWVIDQTLRIILAKAYDDVIGMVDDWDEGIAP